MRYKNDGTFGGLSYLHVCVSDRSDGIERSVGLDESTYPSIGSKLCNQMFRVVVYSVSCNPVCEGCDVCIVTINEYARLLILEH